VNERPAAAAALAFATAFVTLFVQVLVHRVVSAKLLNNYAFLVISLTMLGFALSGVALTRWLDRFLRRLPEAISTSAAAFAVTLVFATVLFYQAPLGEQAMGERAFVLSFLRWSPLALLFAVPFVFAGLILGALLAAPGLSARRIYFFDLLGSAAGAFAVIPAIPALGVENGLLAGCGLLLAAAVAALPPQGARARAAVAVAAAVVAGCAVARERAFDMRYPEGTMLAASRHPMGAVRIEHTAWDPLSRIELSRLDPSSLKQHLFPSLIGTNAAFHGRFRRLLTQNNYAYTYAVAYDGRPESLRGIEETIYAAAYQARSVPEPRVLVIGVGGGFDILTALAFGASGVTGVEVNGATVDLLTRSHRDYFKAWVDDPRVSVVHGEGRHYLATRGAEYDVIQLSGVDSYAGTPAAAHVFSENYLYTAEAFDLYLSRLSPHGIVNMMRLEHVPPREMLRALVTATAALRRAGVDRPADHIVTLTATDGHFTALLVKKSPFTLDEVSRLESWARERPLFAVTGSPGSAPGRSFYQAFLSLGDAKREDAFSRGYPFDITPSTDNRPFFFRYSYWNHLWSADPIVRRTSVPVMELSVLLLLAVLGAVAAACVIVPLRVLASSGLRVPHAGRWAVCFAGAGAGYMAVEIALLQKFGHFLGHPNYALSVVLAALLFFSGVGSLASARIVSALGRVRYTSYLLAGLILALHAAALPQLPRWIGLPFAVRCLVATVLVAPIGVCLGVFVPTALERLKGDAARFVPWGWGINGIFSVLAPVAAIGFSITWGINALLLAALVVYLGVGLAFPDEPAPA
jgi:spermidine synthase